MHLASLLLKSAKSVWISNHVSKKYAASMAKPSYASPSSLLDVPDAYVACVGNVKPCGIPFASVRLRAPPLGPKARLLLTEGLEMSYMVPELFADIVGGAI